MGKNTTTTTTVKNDVLEALYEALGDVLGKTNGPDEDTKPVAKGRGKAKAEPEVEPDEDDDTDEEVSRDEREAALRKMKIAALRSLVSGYGYDDDEVKGADKDTLIDAALEEEFGESDGDEDSDDEADVDEDDVDEEEDADDNEESYTREELEELSLRELKAIAKEAGYTTADMKGLDDTEVINLILEEDESDEDDEDEDDSDEEEGWTEEELQGMSVKELRAVAADNEVKVPRGSSKDDIIELLMGE